MNREHHHTRQDALAARWAEGELPGSYPQQASISESAEAMYEEITDP
jgi:hypothetical protein